MLPEHSTALATNRQQTIGVCCTLCGKPIYAGDSYHDIYVGFFHEDCFCELTEEQIREGIGEEYREDGNGADFPNNKNFATCVASI